MSVQLDSLVSSLVDSAPPGELNGVQKDLAAILPGQERLINSSIESFIESKGGLFGGYVASSLNKLSGSTKFVDYVHKKLFNIDLKNQQAIDIESYEPEETYPSYYDELVELLKQYGKDHYPSTYGFTVIPKNDEVVVIIIGQKLNTENYYTGQWNSVYRIKNGTITGDVAVDIHYYEDGNVRLNFNETLKDSVTAGGRNIVNFINNSENQLTLKIVDSFNDLNVKYFKNLRRLLPITRAKINWGNAIGNYRLGSDVVNQK